MMTAKPNDALLPSENSYGRDKNLSAKVSALEAMLLQMQSQLAVAEQDGDAPEGMTMMQAPEDEGIPTWIPGGDAPGPYLIYLADGTRFVVTAKQAMTGYDPKTDDDWSLEFGVTSNGAGPPVITNPIGTSTVNEPTAGEELLHDADASVPVNQSYYRLPIIRDKKRISFGGAYRQNIYCAGSKGPVVELVRI